MSDNKTGQQRRADLLLQPSQLERSRLLMGNWQEHDQAQQKEGVPTHGEIRRLCRSNPIIHNCFSVGRSLGLEIDEIYRLCIGELVKANEKLFDSLHEREAIRPPILRCGEP